MLWRFSRSASSLTSLIALALGCVSFQACQRKEKAPAPVASASSVAKAQPPRVDDDLLGGLKTIGSACKVDPAEGNVTCAQGENRKLTTMFASGKRKRPAAIATLAFALTDADPALQTVAANLLNTAFRAPWSDEASVGAVDATDARALLQAALNAPKPLARQAVPAAVNAGFLAGIGDEVFAALDKSDPAELRPLGYRYVMTHGRMAAFGKVQELVKDPSPAVSLAVLEAPRNMFAWTEAEKAAICPWAAELLKDPRPAVATRAAGLLGSCTGEFVDLLLERGEKSLKAGELKAAELSPYRDLCSPASLRQPAAATEAQCERNRKLLTGAVGAKKLDSQTRSLALVSLAYQWPDDKTLTLAFSLQTNSDKELAERARGTVKRIEERKATQKAAPAEPKPTSKPTQ
jgi:hypothetical protein